MLLLYLMVRGEELVDTTTWSFILERCVSKPPHISDADKGVTGINRMDELRRRWVLSQLQRQLHIKEVLLHESGRSV